MAYNEITSRTSPNKWVGGNTIKGITIHSEYIRLRNSWIKVDERHEHLLYENVWSESDGYAKRYKEKFDGVRRHRWVEYLHRTIAGAENGDIVDHINQDRSDNRSSNLRIVSKSTNALNTTKNKGYVLRELKNGSKRYDVRLVVDGKSIISKTFDSEDAAKSAYETKKREIIGNVL